MLRAQEPPALLDSVIKLGLRGKAVKAMVATLEHSI